MNARLLDLVLVLKKRARCQQINAQLDISVLMKRTHPVGITHVLQVQKEQTLAAQTNQTVTNVLLENGVLLDQQSKETVHMDSFAKKVKKLAFAKNALLENIRKEKI